jgi:hypothetical protein
MKLFKISIKFNHLLSNRGGRFLTVYNAKGEKINGKVLTTRLLWANIQHAKTGKTQWVRNWNTRVLVADHEVFF